MSTGSIIQKDTIALLTDYNYTNLRVFYARDNIYGLLCTNNTLANDYYLKTFSIDVDGNIGSVLDSVRLSDAGTSSLTDAIAISTADGIILFNLITTASGSIQTRQIAADGTIGTVIDAFSYTDGAQNSLAYGAVAQITSDLFMASYYNNKNTSGKTATFTCDSIGNLSNGFIQTYTYEPVLAKWPQIILQGSDAGKNVVLLTRVEGNSISVVTAVKVSDTGTFESTPTLLDRIDSDDGYRSQTAVVFPAQRIYATVAEGISTQDGWIYSWTLKVNGTVPDINNPIDQYEYAPVKGIYNQIISIDQGVILIASVDTDNDGWVRSWQIDSAGAITKTPLDTFEFANNQFVFEQSMILTEHPKTVLLASRYSGGSVYLFTFEVETPTIVTDTIVIGIDAHIKAQENVFLVSDALIKNIEAVSIFSDSLIIPVWPPTDYVQLNSSAEIIDHDQIIITSEAYIIQNTQDKLEVQSRVRSIIPASSSDDGGFQIF
jgi:hypothetical protein